MQIPCQRSKLSQKVFNFQIFQKISHFHSDFQLVHNSRNFSQKKSTVLQNGDRNASSQPRRRRTLSCRRSRGPRAQCRRLHGPSHSCKLLKSQKNFSSFNFQVLERIFGYLERQDLLNCRKTAKYWSKEATRTL